MPQHPQLARIVGEARRIRADHPPRHRLAQPQLRRALPMRIPKHGGDAACPQQRTRQPREKRHHMGEAGIVAPRRQQPQQEAVEAREPYCLAQRLFAPRRKHADVPRQLKRPAVHGDDINVLAMRRQMPHPVDREAEHRIRLIRHEVEEQQAHLRLPFRHPDQRVQYDCAIVYTGNATSSSGTVRRRCRPNRQNPAEGNDIDP